MANFVKVADAGEITPGTGRCITVNGKEIALFNVGGVFHAIDNTCIHRGGPLGEGELDGAVVTCPWHGWQYDVRTGQNEFDRAIQLRTYDVQVEDGEIRVRIR